ncbi:MULTISPECIES: AzlC family ABC transporter permease [Sulfitobacter]|jgi:predicted branched-subunit amino acid permease|uniref:Inner membrane protein YgaZ n=2 Tax=Sulfitobacter TaxID=60136 RepID=A0A1H2RSM8_9RHOB|nr:MULTISPECIES: AzlC family ABC transporter permease [Sulfitobacter]MAB16638.1 branched-chain amino acid ABC transporter permease [Roseobacter sp.]AXI51878.1 branched-chain amino acid ABC transporter permease [Sulfitobacter sp. SK025]EAP81878.1 AzlC family protein [Sulfitobacter sp. NAS-14.1]EAP85086.1 AzlC family protein [Sulfitobacter sp. EE-36]MAJ77518.1 branched-chain amino acid ABC transporter permease [Roseobacter sp.]|tara:strand:- start:690 stop:1424 length:735 start_codon:yes stop_codon:yes gene_type:complete
MAITTTKSAFRKGLADAAPFVLVIIPFASLFGILATEAGLNVFETLAFSVVVIAGAAQFTALQLMQEHAPTAIVLASALAVNLRMAMYSASLTPYIGSAPLWQRALAAYLTVDQSYVCAMAQYEKQPDMTIPQRMAYFFGCVTPIVPLWYLFTLVGAMVGAQIPESWALDFALPITFLAMIAPMFRTPAHVVAALVASVAGLLTAGVPYSLGLIIAGLAGMMAGAQTELWLERRQPQHPEQDAV